MKNVLIVDDRVCNRNVLVSMLDHRGYRLLEAVGGAQALKIARQQKLDLVIADVLMPKMDGYEFVRQLRLDPRIAQPIVIFYTASYAEREARKLAKACGVDHIIMKPAEPEEVLKIVDQAFATGAPGRVSIPVREFDRDHLNLVTDKLAEKVHDLESLNHKLQAEVAGHRRTVAKLRSAHAVARRARQNAERASRAKDRFLANLSHELRTPLTPVLLCAAALEQDGAIGPEVREQLGMVRRNVELEARLIDDLLDLTRVTNGKMRIQHSGPVDIRSLFSLAEQIVHDDIVANSLTLRIEMKASEHYVGGDAARLQQVFWNLLKNAIKFTPAGGTITARTENPAPGRIILSVSDTGTGIDRELLPVIFNAFEQGETPQMQPAGGLGLGLSISKAIVELHGGTISAKSLGPGLGATFTVELATVVVFPNAQTNAAEHKAEAQAPPLRLLVIEDNESTMTVLSRLLRRRGHDVRTASTVKEALSLAAAYTFDLVISDIGLPDGTGIELMQQLTKGYGLRGIALSGYGMPSDRALSEQAGFLAHLVKPINFDQLHKVLQGVASTTHASAPSGTSGDRLLPQPAVR